MEYRKSGLHLAASFIALFASADAHAYEFGSIGLAQQPGLTIGTPAAAPPPGIYVYEQLQILNKKFTGPGAPTLLGEPARVEGISGATGVVWVPGWSFLGASYSAHAILPFIAGRISAPIGTQPSGRHNLFLAPVDLSWRLGDSGFFAKAAFGMYLPNGKVSGFNGHGGIGQPYWTLQPNVAISYLKDGWNLTANVFYEINTRNTITGYTSGGILHADLTATKTVEKFTFGPVGYYIGQVTSDRSSPFYSWATNTNRYSVWAVGGFFGYDFGRAKLNLWALQDVSARASGGTLPGTATVTKGFSALLSLSYQLWSPTPPASVAPTHLRK